MRRARGASGGLSLARPSRAWHALVMLTIEAVRRPTGDGVRVTRGVLNASDIALARDTFETRKNADGMTHLFNKVATSSTWCGENGEDDPTPWAVSEWRKRGPQREGARGEGPGPGIAFFPFSAFSDHARGSWSWSWRWRRRRRWAWWWWIWIWWWWWIWR